MILGYVEPSGEAPGLARLEVEGAAAALGGRPVVSSIEGVFAVEVPDTLDLLRLAGRLALAWRTLVEVPGASGAESSAEAEGAAGASAAFRRLGRPGGTADGLLRALGAAYVRGGGRIDLTAPQRRYWIAASGQAPGDRLLREVAAVDRASFAGRAMPRLPFRRPVSLAPRLARAAVNLAAVRAGDAVLDPFLGTGALLGEAALLGARVYGIDVDAAMVRGALRNLEHVGVRAEGVAQGDARTVEPAEAPRRLDALVTDPPYGRSSASVGGTPATIVRETLARWSARVRPGGRIVVVTPDRRSVLPVPWREAGSASVRVHRSLSREFRVYWRDD